MEPTRELGRAVALPQPSVRVLKTGEGRHIEEVRNEAGETTVRKVHLGRRRARRRARREGRALEKLERHGVCAPRVLSIEEGPAQSTLVLSHVNVMRTLEELFQEAGPRAARNVHGDRILFLRAALETIERAHDAGVFDADLHAGNVWLTPERAVFLADLHRARHVPACLRRFAARSDLVRFLRFFLAYARPIVLRDILKSSVASNAALIERALGSRRRLLRGKDRRANGSHRSFVRERRKNETWFRSTELGPDLLQWMKEIARGTRSHDPEQVFKESAHRHTSLVSAPGEQVIVKKFQSARGGRNRVRAWRAFQASLAFRHSTLRAPFAFACATFERTSFVFLEYIPGITLSEAIHAQCLPPSAQWRLARQLAAVVARMHLDGLRVRDLRGENFLLEGLEAGVISAKTLRSLERRRWQPAFCDLDAIPRRSRLTRARWARDIARLWATFPAAGLLDERVPSLFFKVYADIRQWNANERASLGAQIRKRRERFFATWQRRGYTWDETGIYTA